MDTTNLLLNYAVQALAGSVAVPMIDQIKKGLKWNKPEDSNKNFALTFGVSIVMAVIALLVTLPFLPITGPESIIAAITMVFTVSQAVYKKIQIVPPVDPPTP